MRYFRRLPPRLRGASGLERAFLAIGVTLATLSSAVAQLSSRHSSVDLGPMEAVAADLGLLCVVCAFAVDLYSTRFRQPDGRPLTHRSWQSLIGFIVLAAALPICGIVLAVVIPPASDAFDINFPIPLIGMAVLLAAYLSMRFRRRAAD
ncbi:MAG TPA: hypothetical protein VF510_17100 [Ktedonobacterales bacterium]